MKNPIQMIKQCVEKEEPYFVLRGQDVCALAAARAYCRKSNGERSLFHRSRRIMKKISRHAGRKYLTQNAGLISVADSSYKTIKQVAEGCAGSAISTLVCYPVRAVKGEGQLEKYRKAML